MTQDTTGLPAACAASIPKTQDLMDNPSADNVTANMNTVGMPVYNAHFLSTEVFTSQLVTASNATEASNWFGEPKIGQMTLYAAAPELEVTISDFLMTVVNKLLS